jgi:para-nitrobenzyl esterase
VERLLEAQTALREDLIADPDPERWGADVVTSMLPWAPVVDGDTLPACPIDRISAGAAADVDLIIGTNLDEHRLFLASTGMIERITDKELAAFLVAYGLPVQRALKHYRAANPNAWAGDMLASLQTDWYWRIPAIRLADAHQASATRAATYMYEFAWPSPLFNGQLGACHALEIPFVFDTLGNATQFLWGDTAPHQLADTMHTAWVHFATNGDCGWPQYEPKRRSTMRFDMSSTVVDDPRAKERALWEGVR